MTANPDEYFRDYNMYRRLVRRHAVEPYAHHCGTEYVSGYGEDDEFVFNCYECDMSIIPGLGDLEKIRAIIERHIDE